MPPDTVIPYRPPYPYAAPSASDNGPSASKVDDGWLRAQHDAAAARNYAPPTPHHHHHHGGGSWRPAAAPTGWGSPQPPQYGRGGPRGGGLRAQNARSSPSPAPAADAPAPAVPAAAPARTERPKWLCPACQFHNFMNRRTCKSCNGARPPKEEIVDPTIVNVEAASDGPASATVASGTTAVADAASKDQAADTAGDAASVVVPTDAAAASAAGDAQVVSLGDAAVGTDGVAAGVENAPVALVAPVASVVEDAAQQGPVEVEATVEVPAAPVDAVAVVEAQPAAAVDATAVEDEVDSILAAAAAAPSSDDQVLSVSVDAVAEPVVSRDSNAPVHVVEREAILAPALETLAADLAAALPVAPAEPEPPVAQATLSTESLSVPEAAPAAESRAVPDAAPAPNAVTPATSAVAPAPSARVSATPASFDPNDPWDNPDLSAPVSSNASIRSVAVSDPWGGDDAEPTTVPATIPSSAAWTCTRCTGKNAASTPYCDTCDAPNPACVLEWACTQCRHANFPTVTACVACKRPRHVAPPTPLDGGVADLRAALPTTSAKPRAAAVVPADKPLPPTPTPDPAPVPREPASTTRDAAPRTSTAAPATRTSATSTSSGRPMTSTFVAKRLIGGALGLRTTNADDRKRHEAALADARAAKREPPKMTLSPRGAPARLLTPPKPTAAAPPRNDWTAMWGDEGGKGASGAYYGSGAGGGW
ncbi:hypothetical protein GGF32_002377 [Allomyces javanicus]|nr:hypothetical protein GGF32_002377 [Allomyces javanicus]